MRLPLLSFRSRSNRFRGLFVLRFKEPTHHTRSLAACGRCSFLRYRNRHRLFLWSKSCSTFLRAWVEVCRRVSVPVREWAPVRPRAEALRWAQRWVLVPAPVAARELALEWVRAQRQAQLRAQAPMQEPALVLRRCPHPLSLQFQELALLSELLLSRLRWVQVLRLLPPVAVVASALVALEAWRTPCPPGGWRSQGRKGRIS